MEPDTNIVSFTIVEDGVYGDSPYSAATITMHIRSEQIPIRIVLNRVNKQVNLNRIFDDLQKGIKYKGKKTFNDFRYSKSTLLFVDMYSMIMYGHIHNKYGNENIYEKINDKDIIYMDPETIHIREEVRVKSNKNVAKQNALHEMPGEIYGEKYSGPHTSCRGQYGDYWLIPKIMSFISPFYEAVSHAFMEKLENALNGNSNNQHVNNVSNELIPIDVAQLQPTIADISQSFAQTFAQQLQTMLISQLSVQNQRQ